MNESEIQPTPLTHQVGLSDRLLVRMSHEIRTAVNSILGLTELLRESQLDPRQKHHVSVARASADHLLKESAEIIDLARAELGSLQLRPVSFDLHETLRQAMELMSFLAGYKNVALRVHISDEVPFAVIGDPERLSQILITLVRAGIDRIEHGEISVIVEAAPGEEKSGIKFSVNDTGPRIPAKVISQIFDGALDSDTAAQAGSGLGLIFSKHLASMMGGVLWAEDGPGSGVAFHFTAKLPAADGCPGLGDLRKGVSGTGIEPRRLKILVAEDTADNLLLIRAFLRDQPWEIDSAHNGRVAVEKALATPYDLILMDIDMPEMDGHTATRQIRVAECKNELPMVPIVALTAHNEAEAAFQSIEAGCTAHVTKPIRKAALIATIQQYAGPSAAVYRDSGGRAHSRRLKPVTSSQAR